MINFNIEPPVYDPELQGVLRAMVAEHFTVNDTRLKQAKINEVETLPDPEGAISIVEGHWSLLYDTEANTIYAKRL